MKYFKLIQYNYNKMIKMIIKYDQKRHHINGEDGSFLKIKKTQVHLYFKTLKLIILWSFRYSFGTQPTYDLAPNLDA